MAFDAFMTQYRREYVALLEQDYSLLRACTVRETVVKGNTAQFLVAGSNAESAVTRGGNGLIPYKQVYNSQNACVLQEKHAPFEITGFNVFAYQGNQKEILQKSSIAVLNRDIDDIILAQLDTGTVTTGTAVTASLDLVMKSLAILGRSSVPIWEEDNMFGVMTPAFHAYLMQVTEFANADYVDVKQMPGGLRQMKRWAGVNWFMHPRISGVGTSSEHCYLFHRSAIGFAANTAEMDVRVGYDEKQDMSWTRATMYYGAKMLQNVGIVQMVHDGSAY